MTISEGTLKRRTLSAAEAKATAIYHEARAGDGELEALRSAPAAALAQIDLAKRIFATYPDRLEEARTANDVMRVFASGKIACLLGIEGGQVIEDSLDTLRRFHDLGARYLTLTQNCTTNWADSALDAPRHSGLTPFGIRVVHEMNRLGMLVDLSHTSPATMHAALDVARAPVIWSHTGARTLVDHPRNVPDDVLSRVRANGGLVMVTFVPAFVSVAHHRWDVLETIARLEEQARRGHGICTPGNTRTRCRPPRSPTSPTISTT